MNKMNLHPTSWPSPLHFAINGSLSTVSESCNICNFYKELIDYQLIKSCKVGYKISYKTGYKNCLSIRLAFASMVKVTIKNGCNFFCNLVTYWLSAILPPGYKSYKKIKVDKETTALEILSDIPLHFSFSPQKQTFNSPRTVETVSVRDIAHAS